MKIFSAKNATIHKSPMGFHKFCDAFEKKNHFTLLGNGYFSRVYGTGEENSLVYKIGLIHESVKKDPYLQFLSKAQQNNSFYPLVRTVTIFKHKNGDFYVIEMEQLDFCNPDALTTEDNTVRKELISLFRKRKEINIKQLFNFYIKKYAENKKTKKLFSCMKKLTTKFGNDMHENNFMMRNDGQLVVIDPVCPKDLVTPDYPQYA